MKAFISLVAFGLSALTYANPCPYAELARRGLLSEDDLAKFEAVKRNPAEAEKLLQLHARDASVNVKTQAQPRDLITGLVGPLLDGALDLPLGGGLRESLYQGCSKHLTDVDSERRSSAVERRTQ